MTATSFDLFGTLVEVEDRENPAGAIAAELAARSIPVPDDWEKQYRTPQIDTEPGAELPLPDHVGAVLDTADGSPPGQEVICEAVLAAFDQPVSTRPGAVDAVAAMAERGPVGILSNCSVPGLVDRTLRRSELDPGQFDAVVTSVGCGWRKPDRRAFEAVESRLNTPIENITHVGDTTETDGGALEAGANVVFVDEVPLTELPAGVKADGGK
jgi:HAD superfamily hydrolase (TIGR01549 family)